MRIDVIRYEPHTLSQRPFKFFFRLLYWFLQLRSCFINWYKKERSIKLRPLGIRNGSCFETLNLLLVSSWEMFTFCDILHEAGDYPVCVLESAQYGLEIIFNPFTPILLLTNLLIG